MFSPDGIVMWANPRLASIFDTTPDRLVGRPFTDFVSPAEREDAKRLTLTQERQEGIAREWQLLRPDGELFPCLLHSWPVLEHGQLICYGARLDPIKSLFFTQRDQNLLEHAALAMDITQEGMAVLQDGVYLWMNSAHAHMYGWDVADLVGKDWRQLYTPAVQRQIESNAFRVLGATGRWRGELQGLRRDGSPLDVEVSLSTGEGGMLVCCCRDISERKREHALLLETLRQLDGKNEALRKASAMKDIFLACMSHELRTPLHAILGTAELLSTWGDRPPLDKQRHYLEQIQTSGDHLLALINDILDVSKISAGQVTLDRELTPVSYLVTTAVDMVIRDAEAKHLLVSLPDPAPDPRIMIDRRRGVQILLNLLSNAIKFTPAHGHIRVDVRTMDQGVEIDVADDGCGFEPAMAERLFQPFVQVDGSLRRAHGGTGLGLYLARQLAELHGGRLSAAALPQKGATFTLRLPYLSFT